MGPELSLQLGPAYYHQAIALMHDNADPEIVREKLSRNFLETLRDEFVNWDNGKGFTFSPPVIVPPHNLSKDGKAKTIVK